MSLPDFSKMTIPRLAVFAAERFGAASAIEEGDVRLSFAELDGAALAATRAFMAAGVTPGDRVGVWAPNMHEWIVAALGIQSAGGPPGMSGRILVRSKMRGPMNIRVPSRCAAAANSAARRCGSSAPRRQSSSNQQ